MNDDDGEDTWEQSQSKRNCPHTHALINIVILQSQSKPCFDVCTSKRVKPQIMGCNVHLISNKLKYERLNVEILSTTTFPLLIL
jgi:hypothetical protein